jgi:hypothetical protein
MFALIFSVVAVFLLMFGAFLEFTYPMSHHENGTRCTPLITNKYLLGIPTCHEVYCQQGGAIKEMCP